MAQPMILKSVRRLTPMMTSPTTAAHRIHPRAKEAQAPDPVGDLYRRHLGECLREHHRAPALKQ